MERSSDEMTERIIKHSSTGRPAGSIDFISALEKTPGRELKRKKPGKKKKGGR